MMRRLIVMKIWCYSKGNCLTSAWHSQQWLKILFRTSLFYSWKQFTAYGWESAECYCSLPSHDYKCSCIFGKSKMHVAFYVCNQPFTLQGVAVWNKHFNRLLYIFIFVGYILAIFYTLLSKKVQKIKINTIIYFWIYL